MTTKFESLSEKARAAETVLKDARRRYEENPDDWRAALDALESAERRFDDACWEMSAQRELDR
jgi:hypothetical protein